MVSPPTTSRDLLEFVRLHLIDESLAALREPQVESVPDFGGGVAGVDTPPPPVPPANPDPV